MLKTQIRIFILGDKGMVKTQNLCISLGDTPRLYQDVGISNRGPQTPQQEIPTF